MNINFVYSGGTQNTSQDKSLGGFPSPVSIANIKNNLFGDITPRQTTQGVTDYRCIYIFNDDSDLKHNVTIFVEQLDSLITDIQLGFLQQNSVQRLQFSTAPTSGSFTISVQGLKSGVISWNNDPDVLATSIQTAIQTVTDCSVTVTTEGDFDFNITFKGVLGNKAIESISVTDNNLSPDTTPTITQVTSGSPINTVAPDTGIDMVAPTGVPFVSATYPGVSIGTIYPSEGFPLWIKRTILPSFDQVEGDGFKLHLIVATDLSSS
jgi:hypothetical protein